MKLCATLLRRIALISLSVIAHAGPLPQHERQLGKPQDGRSTLNLVRRDFLMAGVGIELEYRAMVYENEDQLDHADGEVMDKLKGSDLMLQDNTEASKLLEEHRRYWSLTAELSDNTGIKRIVPEIIVDGKAMKVGATNPSLKQVGESISGFLVSLNTWVSLTAVTNLSRILGSPRREPA